MFKRMFDLLDFTFDSISVKNTWKEFCHDNLLSFEYGTFKVAAFVVCGWSFTISLT